MCCQILSMNRIDGDELVCNYLAHYREKMFQHMDEECNEMSSVLAVFFHESSQNIFVDALTVETDTSFL